LMKLGALTLGAYRLMIIISFWSISPFISMECPSLSRLINVGFMYKFSNGQTFFSQQDYWVNT
jgi:hypothetical protein